MTESILYLSILSLHTYGSTHLWVDLPIDLILKIKSPWFNLCSLNYLAQVCLSAPDTQVSFFPLETTNILTLTFFIHFIPYSPTILV